MKQNTIDDKITFVCTVCGQKMYGAVPELATWHVGKCDVCNKEDVVVTEGRDYRRAFGIMTQLSLFDENEIWHGRISDSFEGSVDR